MLDLALAEYRMRRAAGESVEATRFCEQFSTYREEIRRMLSVERGLPSCDDPDWPACGSAFLEFDLLNLLGTGAASRVYLASQTTIGNRRVALKVTPYGTGEAGILGKLDHPHVVPVFSVHEDADTGLSAVCMPYLGAATLQDVVQAVWSEGSRRARPTLEHIVSAATMGTRGDAPGSAVSGRDDRFECESHFARDREAGRPARGAWIERAEQSPPRKTTYWQAIARIGADLADGLAYTHTQGILHHDLKPSNVLLTPACHPMLLDFNLAWDARGAGSRMGGTLPYMAPEQFHAIFLATGDAAPSSDPRTDLYSLGAVLFQLATGRLPRGLPPSDMGAAVKFMTRAYLVDAPPVRSIRRDVPRRLAAAIDGCLKTAILDRPPDGSVLANELRACARSRRPARILLVGALAAAATLGAADRLGALLPNGDAIVGKRGPDASAAPRAVAFDADRAFAEWLVAFRTHWNAGAYSSAETALEQAIAVRDSADLRRVLLYCRFKHNAYGDAIHIGRQLAAEFPDDAAIANNLGRCALQSGDYRLARFHLDRAVRLAPTHFVPLHNRAFLNTFIPEPLRDADDGTSLIERAIAAAPDRPVLHCAAAVLYDMAASRSGANGPDLAERLKQHVIRAAELGFPSRMLAGQPFARSFANDPWFRSLVETAASNDRGGPFDLRAEMESHAFIAPSPELAELGVEPTPNEVSSQAKRIGSQFTSR